MFEAGDIEPDNRVVVGLADRIRPHIAIRLSQRAGR
jgi:hypothetical protein